MTKLTYLTVPLGGGGTGGECGSVQLSHMLALRVAKEEENEVSGYEAARMEAAQKS